ncbi:MAG: hypothetical protein ABI443_05335 [Chthoniobacterales bacterium]
MKSCAAILLSLFVCTTVFAIEPVSLTPEEALDHFDQLAIVRGVVKEIVTDSGGNTYVSFGGKLPDIMFSGFIFPMDLGKFPNLDSFVGKKVEIEGKISYHYRRARIVMTSPAQIRLSE